jgi:hypothetical protein
MRVREGARNASYDGARKAGNVGARNAGIRLKLSLAERGTTYPEKI